MHRYITVEELLKATEGEHVEFKEATPFRELEQVLPSHSKAQIKVLMRELQRDNRIYAIGKTSSAKWFAR